MYANTRARQGKNINFSRENCLILETCKPRPQNDTGDILEGIFGRRKRLFRFIARLGKWSQYLPQ